jgi:hypothetical protein
MGKKLHFSTGYGGGGLYTVLGPVHLAGFSVSSYLAQLCAKYKVKIVASTCMPEAVAVQEDALRQGFVAEGVPEEYSDDMVRFWGSNVSAYNWGTVTMMYRENFGAQVLIGALWPSDMLPMGDAGALMGCMQVGAGYEPTVASQTVAVCDYALIGEEVPAAGAYVSKEPVALGSLAGQDWSKLIVTALIIIGTLTATAGYDLTWIFTT